MKSVKVVLTESGIAFEGRVVKNFVDFDKIFKVSEVIYVPTYLQQDFLEVGDVIRIPRTSINCQIYSAKKK